MRRKLAATALVLASGCATQVPRPTRITTNHDAGAPSLVVLPDQFSTSATTTVSLPAGVWKVRTVSDCPGGPSPRAS